MVARPPDLQKRSTTPALKEAGSLFLALPWRQTQATHSTFWMLIAVEPAEVTSNAHGVFGFVPAGRRI
jgi:hypothetical protein